MTSKKIILPALALAGLLAVGSLSATTAQAMENERGLPLIQRIAERFGLNESEVEEVFSQYRVEHHLAMQSRFEEHLALMVEEGKLTQAQADAIIQKHEEMRADHEALVTASPEEKREYRASQRAEMEAWAAEEGIELPQLRAMGRLDGEVKGSGRGLGAHLGVGLDVDSN